MAAQNRETNITGLVINLQSRVYVKMLVFYIFIQIYYYI